MQGFLLASEGLAVITFFLAKVCTVGVIALLAWAAHKTSKNRKLLRELGIGPRSDGPGGAASWNGCPVILGMVSGDVSARIPVDGLDKTATIRPARSGQGSRFDEGAFGSSFDAIALTPTEIGGLTEQAREDFAALLSVADSVGLFRGHLQARLKRPSTDTLRRTLDLLARTSTSFRAAAEDPTPALANLALEDPDPTVRQRALERLRGARPDEALRSSILERSDRLEDTEQRLAIALALDDRLRLEQSVSWPDVSGDQRAAVNVALARLRSAERY